MLHSQGDMRSDAVDELQFGIGPGPQLIALMDEDKTDRAIVALDRAGNQGFDRLPISRRLAVLFKERIPVIADDIEREDGALLENHLQYAFFGDSDCAIVQGSTASIFIPPDIIEDKLVICGVGVIVSVEDGQAAAAGGKGGAQLAHCRVENLLQIERVPD